MGAAREPDDVARSMARIEDEAARMGVLVEDLLTLARLDQVPDVPHVEVDLARIARDARRRRAGDRARPRDRAARVDAPAARRRRPAPAAPGARQPAAQRARPHAGGHADRGDGPARRAAASRVEVRDHGPGLPTDAPEALFERFWRAEGGRERGRAGAGLGLAIVAGDRRRPRRAGARRRTPPGGGAAFVVELPAAARSQRLSGGSDRAPTSRADAGGMTNRSSSALPTAAAGGAPCAMPASLLAPRAASAAPSGGRHRSTSSCRSSTSRPRWSAASAGCTTSSARSCRSRWRIVIADNASTDATPRVAARLAPRRCPASRCCGWSARAAAARCGRPGRRATRASSATWTSTSRRTCARCCRSSRRCCRATATWPSAPAWPTAPASSAAPSASSSRAPTTGCCTPRCAPASPTPSAASRPCARDALDGLLRRRARRRLVLRHRAAGARPAARAAHPRGPGGLGGRPRLARGHRPHGARRPARRRAAAGVRPGRALRRRRRASPRSPTRCSSSLLRGPLGAGGRQRRRAGRDRGRPTPRPTGA